MKIALDVAKAQGIMPIVMNGCNEVLVERFLKGQITYLEIANYLDKVLNKFENNKIESVEQILEVDKLARTITTQIMR